MPYKSDAQRRWAHTKEGTEALGGSAKVAEWDRASKGLSLPERKNMDKFSSRPKPGRYLRGGPVQAEGRSWAKSARVDNSSVWSTPDQFTGTPGVNKSYGKSGGSVGSGGTHGPNCSCATCKARWGS